MKPTSTEAAICCMIVSNPSGGMQPHGWQKRVNDLIRAQDQELTTLRAEFELLTAVKDAHKMRGDNHWMTLRSIRILAQEGKLEHIIQHVSDAGAGYMQPDEVTMWELQSALSKAETDLATLRASEAAAMERIAALTEAAQALGAMPEGYCFCSKDRIGDDSKIHEPECRDLRAVLGDK